MARRKLSAKARRQLLRGLAILAAVVIVPLVIIVLVLDHRVTAQFEGRRWTLPARVYAQPVELYVGQTLSAEDETALKSPILEKYDLEGSPYYSTARLWDDGVLDPAKTREALALGLSAAYNAPIAEPRFGVFRM